MKLLRIMPFLSVLSFLLVPSISAAEILTNDAVLRMVKAGLGEELIVSKIKASQNQFDLTTDGILKLKNEGVSEKIIQAMMITSPAPPVAEESREAQDAIALYRQGKVVEAVAAFDKLLAKRPNDDGLKIWKALALLEQARAMRESKASGYKPLVVNAYAILRSAEKGQAGNPDWLFGMAKAFWLNERPERANRVAKRVLDARPNYAEAHLLLGDMAYEERVESRPGPVTAPNQRWWNAVASRKAYETALGVPDLPSHVRAEALYKMGLVSADLENKKETAREYWEKAVAADADSRHGKMAQEKLTAVLSK